MQCRICGGAGKISGTFYRNGQYVSDIVVCDWCNGTGKIKRTNEQWFCSLPTEEKADVLNEFVMEAYYDGLDGKIPKMHCCKDFQHWLKKEHKE